MKDDLERDLRELFDRKASEGATAPRVPDRVVRRSRRRQAGVAAISMFTVVALAGVSLAGSQVLDQGRSDPRMPAGTGTSAAGRYPVLDRTVDINGLQVTSPSDWYLVDQFSMGLGSMAWVDGTTCGGAVAQTEPASEETGNGDNGNGDTGTVEAIGDVEECEPLPPADREEPTGPLPAVQLSNRDMGLEAPACGYDGTGPVTLTGDDAVMAVVIDHTTVDEIVDGWTDGIHQVEFDASSEPIDGICGPGYYQTFATGGFQYIAWAGFGPDATEQDRQVVLGSLEAIGLDAFGIASARELASYVVAGGQDWLLEVAPSRKGDGNIDLTLQGEKFGGISSDFTVPAVPIEECCELSYGSENSVKVGVVTKEASGVELRYDDGSPSVPGTLVQLPPSLAFDFDLFFAEAPHADRATAAAVGVA